MCLFFLDRNGENGCENREKNPYMREEKIAKNSSSATVEWKEHLVFIASEPASLSGARSTRPVGSVPHDAHRRLAQAIHHRMTDTLIGESGAENE